jgi:hypothetical protein
MNFSKEVGEESNSLSLNAKAKTTFYLYDKDELIDKILSEIKSEVKEGYVVERSLIDHKVNDTSLKDEDTVQIDATVSAKTVKKVNEEEIVKLVLGRNKNSLNSLKEKLGIEGYTLNIKEPIPVLNNFLPFFRKNINIIMTTL